MGGRMGQIDWCLPPNPPRCRQARLVAWKDLLAGEGIVCERALETIFADVLYQERAALHIDVLEDVNAAQPFVARDPGFGRTLLIPFRKNIVWAHPSGGTDFFKLLNPGEHVVCEERILEGHCQQIWSNNGKPGECIKAFTGECQAPNEDPSPSPPQSQ